MLRSRLFWKLFLGFTLVNLLATAALMWATWAWQRDQASDLAQAQLATAAALLADDAAAWTQSPDDAALAERLDARAVRAGVDLSAETDGGASHDFVRDSNAYRDDATPQEEFLRLKVDGRAVGDLRVRRPGETLAATLAGLWARYVFFAPAAALAMVAVGYGLVAHLVAPVRSLNRAASAMVAGNYRHRAFVTNRDELGQLARSFNQMSEDLTRRLGELQESDRRQATVLGGMIEGVVAIDGRGRVLLANPAAGKLFGFNPQEVVGRQLIEAVRNHPLHQASIAAIETRSPQRLEIEWDDRSLSVQVTPLVGEPTTGAVVVLHDTTELRRLEKLRRDFVANVSHELKTPLSTIKANAETLLRGAVDDLDNRMRFLEGIDEQSDRLADLIQDMLHLARIESAQQPFDIHSVPVEDAVTACLRDYEHRAVAKQIALSIEANGAAGVLVKADREGLRVILNNLIDNAIKYTPEGGRVWVAWRRADEGRARLVTIEVGDTGAGIPEEKLARVFERFYRVDEARSRHLGGTGLGLSIVKHLAQSFGGSVSVENGEPSGARFAVTLPAA